MTQQLSRVISAIFYPVCAEASIYPEWTATGTEATFSGSSIIGQPRQAQEQGGSNRLADLQLIEKGTILCGIISVFYTTNQGK